MMSSSRELFTIGIELEFLMQGNEGLPFFKEVADWLTSKGIPAAAVEDPKTQVSLKPSWLYFVVITTEQIPACWVVKQDPSISLRDTRVGPPKARVEIVSPVLIDNSKDPETKKAWKALVQQVMLALVEKYLFLATKSCGFHVHIGVGAESLGMMDKFTLVDLKKIATVIYLFEGTRVVPF